MNLSSLRMIQNRVIAKPSSAGKAFLNLFLVLFLMGCAQEQVPKQYTKEDVRLTKYNWRGELPEKSKVILVNRFGNITTRTTKQNKIEMSGIIQKVGEYAPEPEVKVSDKDGVTKIEIVYDKPTIDEFDNRIGRMDVGIYVPKGITVEMVTTFGDIKSKKHSSNLIATSVSGKIKLQTKGTMFAHSEAGDIKAHLMAWTTHPLESTKKKRKYHLRSTRGDVSVYFPGDLSLELNAVAKKLSSEDDLFLNEIQKLKELNFNYVLGSGERLLKAISDEGSIFLNPQGKFEAQLSYPQSFEGDVRELPETKPWKPGDPIIEIQDGRSEKKGRFRSQRSEKDSSKDSGNDQNQDDNQEKKDIETQKESPI